MGRIKDWLIGGQELLDKQLEKANDDVEEARYEGMVAMFRELTNWDVRYNEEENYHELKPMNES